MDSLSSAVRNSLLPLPEVSRLSSLRRSTSLFSQGGPADSLYFIDSGLLKLTRTNETGDRLILAMAGPGELVGEEALVSGPSAYQTDAEVITGATVYKIPADVVIRTVQENPAFAVVLVEFLLQRRLAMARKVELLCLHDVEYRILHYLAELTYLVRTQEHEETYHLPITQAELADLIGATRETTSTTLNQLERRGLIKLSRRLLSVPSPALLRNAAASLSVADPVTAKSA